MNFSLAFVADTVGVRGGHERAAVEVIARLARRLETTVIATDCELGAVPARFLRVRGRPARPSVLRTWFFARLARSIERKARCTITNSIGAAALDADVITAQFCHAAFTARFGGLRGGSGLRAAYQSCAQRRFVAEERRAYGSSRLKRVIAVSHGIARELCEFYGTSPECVTVVPNGVDHAVFRPAANDEAKKALRRELGLPSGEFLALFVGRDFERKGLRDAIAAIAGVGDARLVVLGPEASGGVERHARRVGAEKQLHFAGFSLVPERYYAACDAFVFPSRYEGFSLANLEAAASGLPIVAHAVNGTDELVVQGENGWLVPPGPDALREKLILLRDDSVELGRLSRGALASALPYGWDDIATRQLRVFEEAAALAADRAGVPAPAVEGALI